MQLEDIISVNGVIHSCEYGVSDIGEKLLTTLMSRTDLAGLPLRKRIEEIEKEMLKYEQIKSPVVHSFADGLYIRQFIIPAGTLLTSRYHKKGQFDVMLTGRKVVLTDSGIVEMVAPYFGVSKAGIKRFSYAYEDVLWADIHANPTDERDIDKLEAELYADTYEEMLEYEMGKSNLMNEESVIYYKDIYPSKEVKLCLA